ncbi:hypothetical protein RHGRI_029549 [Rhododendron griersonianum]|nr:hypothetical protein RHGRI_029549 [Rhododendron griersonianum]
MEFSIFVNEQVVVAKGYLVEWSGGNGIAIYKDYVVMMEGDRTEGKHDLLIVLHPHNHEWTKPTYATLKGIEVQRKRYLINCQSVQNSSPLGKAQNW